MPNFNSPVRSAGAMTMAMQAARSTNSRPKVLRVGLLCETRVLQEQLADGDAPVTLGTTEACTFAVDSARLPPRLVVFSHQNARCLLHITESMEGRVALHDGLFTLEQLRTSGRARMRRPGIWTLALDESSRGRVTVAGVSLLFQFVVAPAPGPRPQLPIAIRHRPMRAMDWTYNACLAGFLALAFGGMSYLEYGYDPTVDDDFDLSSNRVATLLAPSVPEPPPPAVRDPSTTSGARTPPTPARTPAPAPHSGNTPANHSDPGHAVASNAPHPSNVVDAANQALRASNTALHALEQASRFDHLTAAGTDDHGIADRLAQGNPMEGTVASLGNGVSDANAPGMHRNLVASNAAPGDGLGRGSHAATEPEVTDGPAAPMVDHGPAGRVVVNAPSDPDGPGDVNQDDVARVVRQNLSGIRWCYNEGLRQNPTLSGRVEVHFTLGGVGRIVGEPRVTGFDAAPGVRDCISGRFRSMRFPAAVGGSVQFSFPFQFDPGA